MFSGMVLEGDDYKLKQGFFLNWHGFFYGSWKTEPWLGGPDYFSGHIGLEKIVQFLLPDWNGISTTMTFFVIGLSCLIASYYFFRSLKFEKKVCFIGSFIFTFSPIFFTYIRAGHTGKLFAIIFFALTLTSINQIWNNKNLTIKLIQLALAALTLTIGLIQGAYQTYVYLMPVLIAYCLLLFLDKQKASWSDHFKANKLSIICILLVPIVFFIVAYGPIDSAFRQLTNRSIGSLFSYQDKQVELDQEQSNYLSKSSNKKLNEEKLSSPLLFGQVNAQGNTRGNAQGKNNLSKKNQNLALWDWATQWSLPVIETVDFFFPGIFGLLSNDPDYPYWGGVGRSLFWDQNRQGLFNYSLTSHYLGIFMAIFLIYSLFFVQKKIKWFWLSLILFNLFLSYGKYFPIYELFYDLPYVEKLRNPNKFLLVFFFCTAVLSVYGLNDFYFKVKKKVQNPKLIFTQENKFFKIFWITINVLLILSLVWVLANENSIKNTIGGYFNQNSIIASKIHSNIIIALLRSLVLYNTTLYILSILIKKNLKITLIRNLCLGLVSLLLLDQYFINRHFFDFKKINTSGSDEPLTAFFLEEKKKAPFRVKILTPNSRYINFFKWELARRYRIELMEYWALRDGKVPERERNYINTINNNDLRVFKLANVKFLLSNQPFNHPEITLIEEFQSNSTRETIYIYELKNTLDRLYLVDKVKFVNDNKAVLQEMNKNSFDFNHEVIYNLGNSKLPGPLEDYTKEYNYISSNINDAQRIILEPGFSDEEYLLKVNITKPKILVLLNPNSPWQATADGMPLKKIGRDANYYFNSFVVPQDTKEVKVKFGRLTPQYNKTQLRIYLLTLFLFLALIIIKRLVKKR